MVLLHKSNPQNHALQTAVEHGVNCPSYPRTVDMKIRLIIKIATAIALLFAIAWAIFEPSFEPVITSITLSAALVGLFFDRSSSENQVEESEGLLVIDGSQFLGVSNSIKKLPFDERLKVWELLEIIQSLVPEAMPSNFGNTWKLKDLSSNNYIHGLAAFSREKGFLEEEARSLSHIGVNKNTTLQIQKI